MWFLIVVGDGMLLVVAGIMIDWIAGFWARNRWPAFCVASRVVRGGIRLGDDHSYLRCAPGPPSFLADGRCG
jgi:hypothetical protein